MPTMTNPITAGSRKKESPPGTCRECDGKGDWGDNYCGYCAGTGLEEGWVQCPECGQPMQGKCEDKDCIETVAEAAYWARYFGQTSGTKEERAARFAAMKPDMPRSADYRSDAELEEAQS